MLNNQRSLTNLSNPSDWSHRTSDLLGLCLTIPCILQPGPKSHFLNLIILLPIKDTQCRVRVIRSHPRETRIKTHITRIEDRREGSLTLFRRPWKFSVKVFGCVVRCRYMISYYAEIESYIRLGIFRGLISFMDLLMLRVDLQHSLGVLVPGPSLQPLLPGVTT